ncbi:hypothetical protein MMC13_005419 [Lambiella insularis]|nr:hypothetical protein [Lambiella insularis]
MEPFGENSQIPRQDSFSDSAIGTPTSSTLSTTSIDTVTYARIKDGGDCRFPPTLPYNEEQGERWDLLHKARQWVLGSLIHAPITAPDDILDVGTTTGIWAVDAADANPRARVVGWDKTTHLQRWVPPNLDLIQFDYEQEWGVRERFNLVNIATPDVHDWPFLFLHSCNALRPGGWVQCTGVVLHPMSDQREIPLVGHLRHLCGIVREAWRECGVDLDAPLSWKRQLEASGFEDVRVREYKIPCHRWPRQRKLKEIGRRFADWLDDEISAAGEYLFE